MNATQFDKIVEARAHERMGAKIKAFKKTVLQAARLLLDTASGYYGEDDAKWPDATRNVIARLASDNNRIGWPRHLWEREREAVAEELLDILDEMQKALIAAGRVPSEDDNQPGDS